MSVKRIILLFLITGVTSGLAAQNGAGGFAGSFSRMGFSPRGMAMGNAMTSVTGEGSYSYYNPAIAALESEFIQVDAATASLPFDRRLNMAHSHFQLPPTAGFTFSLVHARVGNIDGRDQSGYHTETLSTNEFQVLGNFAIRFSESFWAGIGLNYNFARYHTDIPNSSGVGIDAGVLIKPVEKMRIGITVQDLLAAYRFNSSDLYGTDSAANRKQAFPFRIIGGVSLDLSDEWIVSLDVESRRQTFERIAVTDDDSGSQEQSIRRGESSSFSKFIRIGSRYHLHERVTLRAGTQLNDLGGENILQPGAGFSIHLPYDTFSPSIDYAFVREPSQLSTMHVFAIRLNI